MSRGRASLFCRSGVPIQQCDFHKVYLGGGFGRRGRVDYVQQVVQIAKQMPGIPVKLIWGNADPYFPLSMAEERRSHFKDASIHVLAAGHWLQSDVPELVAKVMLS